MTLPTSYSWYVRGQRLCIPYESPQGRRVNAIGAHFTHGPETGRLEFKSWAALPQSRARKPRHTPAQRAALQGLKPEETGAIDAVRLLAFIWQVAGCSTQPHASSQPHASWKRERPLMIVLDNYSVHKSQLVQEALPDLEAADIYLVYLPAYSPELSGIEPVWNDVKAHQMPIRSFEQVASLKHAVDDALHRKAKQLQKNYEL